MQDHSGPGCQRAHDVELRVASPAHHRCPPPTPGSRRREMGAQCCSLLHGAAPDLRGDGERVWRRRQGVADDACPHVAWAPESPIRYTCTVVARLAMITRAAITHCATGLTDFSRSSWMWMKARRAAATTSATAK